MRLLILFSFITSIVLAKPPASHWTNPHFPPPPPGGGAPCWPPPCIPIDSHLVFLIIAGLFLGYWRLKLSNNKLIKRLW